MRQGEKDINWNLRSRAATEAESKTILELGRCPEDPVQYALKPTLGGLFLVIAATAILGVEPNGLQSLALFGVLGSLFWVLHSVQSSRRREWDRVRKQRYEAAIERLQLGSERGPK